MGKVMKLPENQARKEGKPMAANEKEVTSITVKDENGNKYLLEFNSRVVKRMERNGFKLDTNYPNIMVNELFTGAFQMHNKGITQDKAMEIWRYQRNKDGLLSLLIKLYMKPLEDLMDEPEGNDSEDPTWETA